MTRLWTLCERIGATHRCFGLRALNDATEGSPRHWWVIVQFRRNGSLMGQAQLGINRETDEIFDMTARLR